MPPENQNKNNAKVLKREINNQNKAISYSSYIDIFDRHDTLVRGNGVKTIFSSVALKDADAPSRFIFEGLIFLRFTSF
jgi:hypothetical protein